MELSPKERRFVAEYLKDQNATQAAKRAGYSAKTAQQQGSRLLLKVVVRDAVDAAMSRIQAKSELTQEIVRAQILALLLFDPRKAFNSDGTMKDMSSLPDDIAIAIAGVEVDDSQGDVKKLKFTDRIRAAELAAKILGMVNRLEITGKNGRPLMPAIPQIDFSKVDHKTLLRIAGMRDDDSEGN